MAIATDFVGSAQKITPLFRSQNLCGTPWRRCCRGLQMCAWFSPTVGASDSEAEEEEEDWERQHRRDLAAVRARDLKDCRVVVSLLLRAGAHISAEEIYRICRSGVLPDPLGRYLFKVIAAGCFTAYERAHRARLVAMLVPKLTHMPADNIPLVVDFWAHVGSY